VIAVAGLSPIRAGTQKICTLRIGGRALDAHYVIASGSLMPCRVDIRDALWKSWFDMKGRSQVFLRFVLMRNHPDTGVEEGIFGAAYELRNSALTPLSDRQLLDSLLSWFEMNLATPARFNRTKSKGFYRRKTAGLSWLKHTADEHITKMRELIVILEENGYRISQITTKPPGYVVFEDGHQVVAEPFRNARK
jgi:hypothetical protein